MCMILFVFVVAIVGLECPIFVLWSVSLRTSRVAAASLSVALLSDRHRDSGDMPPTNNLPLVHTFPTRMHDET